jgi:hypothetical protein
MLGTLAGDTLQTGPGRAYKDGTLGCIGCGAVLQSGAGYAFKDGSLGGQMATGPGRAFRSGSLGAAMQRGPGYAFRSGSLGRVRRLNRLRGLGTLSISSDMLVGLALGVGGALLIFRRR